MPGVFGQTASISRIELLRNRGYNSRRIVPYFQSFWIGWWARSIVPSETFQIAFGVNPLTLAVDFDSDGYRKFVGTNDGTLHCYRRSSNKDEAKRNQIDVRWRGHSRYKLGSAIKITEFLPRSDDAAIVGIVAGLASGKFCSVYLHSADAIDRLPANAATTNVNIFDALLPHGRHLFWPSVCDCSKKIPAIGNNAGRWPLYRSEISRGYDDTDAGSDGNTNANADADADICWAAFCIVNYPMGWAWPDSPNSGPFWVSVE